MADSSRFWDRLAARYIAQPIADEQSYETKLEITRSYFRPDMDVLEIGAGSGATALLHAPHIKHIHAIDFSEKMVAHARASAEEEGAGNVTFEQADIDTYSAPDGSYDMVLGLSILHLLKDKDAVIAKVHEMLKPGGVFITSTACIGDSMPLLKFVAPLGSALGLLPQLDFMTRAQLRESMEQAGFAIERDWLPGKGKAVFMVAKKAA